MGPPETAERAACGGGLDIHPARGVGPGDGPGWKD